MIPINLVLSVGGLNPQTSPRGQHILGVFTSNPQADSLKIKIMKTFEYEKHHLRQSVVFLSSVMYSHLFSGLQSLIVTHFPSLNLGVWQKFSIFSSGQKTYGGIAIYRGTKDARVITRMSIFRFILLFLCLEECCELTKRFKSLQL